MIRKKFLEGKEEKIIFRKKKNYTINIDIYNVLNSDLCFGNRVVNKS